ncbi:hypothetical protein TNCV_12451 [Trichonephila clavipes]|nr:hypothetical protein TNCV_12451 [Trichonephila clavipes]
MVKKYYHKRSVSASRKNALGGPCRPIPIACNSSLELEFFESKGSEGNCSRKPFAAIKCSKEGIRAFSQFFWKVLCVIWWLVSTTLKVREQLRVMNEIKVCALEVGLIRHSVPQAEVIVCLYQEEMMCIYLVLRKIWLFVIWSAMDSVFGF